MVSEALPTRQSGRTQQRGGGRFSLTSPRRRPIHAVSTVILAVVAVAFALPFLWLLWASINKGAGPTLGSDVNLSLTNYDAILNWSTLYKPVINSLYLAGGAAVLTSVMASLAAYPLSRYRMRFRRQFLYGLVFTTGLPISALMVPVYALFAHFQLTDSLPATTAFMTATSLPFAIWLMKNFMDGVPVALEEAAWTDGAGWFASLRYIVLPLMAPGIAVVFIFTFVVQWGDFFVPFILLIDPDKLPASVTIYTFFSGYGQAAYGQLAAFSVLYTAPVVVLYLVMSRFLGGAFSFTGAVKG
jgi:multiple sugar transport system permease protein